jgi:hypothetical protein
MASVNEVILVGNWAQPRICAPPLVTFLGFYAGSGGVDGDDGSPDLTCWRALNRPLYHGLPFEMSMEAHQAAMGVSGAAEAAYVVQRGVGREPVLLYQGPPAGASPGRKVVDGIARTAAHARDLGKAIFGRFGKPPGG